MHYDKIRLFAMIIIISLVFGNTLIVAADEDTGIQILTQGEYLLSDSQLEDGYSSGQLYGSGETQTENETVGVDADENVEIQTNMLENEALTESDYGYEQTTETPMDGYGIDDYNEDADTAADEYAYGIGSLIVINATYILNGSMEIHNLVSVSIGAGLGESAHIVSDVPTGNHRVTITGDNIEELVLDVEIIANGIARLDLSSVKFVRARLDVVTNVTEARIYIDGEFFNINEPIYLPFGEYRIKISSDWHDSIERDVTFDYDNRTVRFTLTPNAGYLNFDINPSWTRVYIDGVHRNVTQPIFLLFGEYTIRITSHGYEPHEKTVPFNRNNQTVRVALSQISEQGWRDNIFTMQNILYGLFVLFVLFFIWIFWYIFTRSEQVKQGDDDMTIENGRSQEPSRLTGKDKGALTNGFTENGNTSGTHSTTNYEPKPKIDLLGQEHGKKEDERPQDDVQEAPKKPLKIVINNETKYKPEVIGEPLEFYGKAPNPRDREVRYLIFSSGAYSKLLGFIDWNERTSRNQVEQGGVLLGKVQQYRNEIYSFVEDVLLADTKGSPTFVEFTPKMWEDMQNGLSKINDDRKLGEQLLIVGWYHTHPNSLSIFMSGTDMNTQRLNFKQDWQVSLILNPHSREHKAFFGAVAMEGKIIKKSDMKG